MEQQANNKKVSPIQVFSEGSRLWWSKFATLSRIYLVFYAPILLFNGLILIFEGLPKPGRPPTVASTILTIIGFFVGIWSAISFILELGNKGQSGHWSGDIKKAEARFLPYVAATILYYLFSAGIFMFSSVFGGFIAGGLFATGRFVFGAIFILVFIIPAVCVLVYFGLRWMFFGVACVLEGLSPIASLKRSFVLLKNHVTPLVGVSFLFGLLSIFTMLPLFIIGMGLKTRQAGYVFGIGYNFLASLFLLPLWFAIEVSFYSKIKEGNAA